jgi:hypothetical protein
MATSWLQNCAGAKKSVFFDASCVTSIYLQAGWLSAVQKRGDDRGGLTLEPYKKLVAIFALPFGSIFCLV